ncbi:MAG: glycosyltransferase [Exilispira sp.]
MGFSKIFIFYYKKDYGILKSIKTDSRFISIIIPSRNEEKRIVKLLESLKNQNYKNFEVIVVDDNSNDNLKEVTKSYKSFNVKYFKLPYNNWAGKSAACYYGTYKAKADYFLFLDADIFLMEDAIEYINKYIIEDGIISIQPYHTTVKLYEQFSLYCNIITFLGLDLGNIKNPYKTRSGLFGPCVLIPRKIYQKSNGHLMVKDSILEDMELGIEFSKRKINLYSIPHRQKIKFRMYEEGFIYLFDGWTKNMVLGAQKSNILSFIIISSIITLSISLPLNIMVFLIKNNLFQLYINILLYIMFSLLLYFGAKKIGSFSPISCLLFPVFAIFYLIIFARSLFMKIFRIPIKWRGRKVIIR